MPGAFTDARKIRTGIIASAGEGTLLLDEMHTLDLGVQKQLLQVFDKGTYGPVGSDRVQTAACRFIVAMKDDPEVLMDQGLLLKDLRYRFGMCSIRMAPLRERRGEIRLLAQQAVQGCRARSKVEAPPGSVTGHWNCWGSAIIRGIAATLKGWWMFAYLVAKYQQAAEIRPEHVNRMS